MISNPNILRPSIYIEPGPVVPESEPVSPEQEPVPSEPNLISPEPVSPPPLL